MSKIKKQELQRVYDSLGKPKQRVLPMNVKKPKKVDYVYQIKSSKPVIYLVDGYNLMYSLKDLENVIEQDLISARDKVVDIVCDFQGYSGAECILVFDAYKNDVSIPVVTKEYNITIVYTKALQTADMYIEQKAEELGNDYKVFVVTSDGLEQLKILSSNCLRLSCKEFMHRYENLKKRHPLKHSKSKHQPLKELRSLLFEDE